MSNLKRKVIIAVSLMFVMSALTGCTNWKKKYSALDVEHQNLKGLYENSVATLDASAAEKAQLSQQLSESQRQLEEMKKQLAAKKPASDVTGFSGDVSVDPQAGTITVTLPSTILFASGQAKLKSTSELDDIYRVLRERYSGRRVDVVGHTDSDPISKTKDKWQDNWDLSAARSLTVLRHLTSRGVSPANIRAVACGESRPVASNSTAAGKSKNRRVEIVVHMK